MGGSEAENIAVVFPGQGAQRSGMGKDFYDGIRLSRETYEEASEAVGWDIAAMCFGEDEYLNLTEFTQPCILTTEIAMLRGLQALFGFSSDFYGGHSLGEFTALVAAGVLPLSAAVKIVQIRGRLMQEAVPVGMGAMVAIIHENVDIDLLQRTLRSLPLDLANINSVNQVVISGKAEAVSEAESKIAAVLEKEKPFRFVPLNVSAPFHSRFMDSIVEPFQKTLLSVGAVWKAEKATIVTSNYTGRFHSGHIEDVVSNLVFQLNHAVRWVDNMKNLSSRANKIYEVGPGRPLRDFFRTMDVFCTSITTLSSAERLLSVNKSD
jgi:[acyl-carrier-protein] S-malonyltransferase/trans-AT polyketide synthase/acyltransferase/oxidoreductase domain-containing protein